MASEAADIPAPTSETRREEIEKKVDQPTHISLHKVSDEEKNQDEQLKELPAILECNSDVIHEENDTGRSDQNIEGEHFLKSPSIVEDPSVAHKVAEKPDKVSQEKVTSTETINDETSKINELQRKSETGSSSLQENTPIHEEAGASSVTIPDDSKPLEDISTNHSHQSAAEKTEENSSILDESSQVKDDEGLEKGNDNISVAEASREDSNNDSSTVNLLESEKITQVKEEPIDKPSEFSHLTVEDIKESSVGENAETTPREDRSLTGISKEVVGDKTTEKTADSVDLKEECVEAQNVTRIASNEEIEENSTIEEDDSQTKNEECLEEESKESPVSKSLIKDDRDVDLGVIHEPRIEHEESEVSENQKTESLLHKVEAETERPVEISQIIPDDTKTTASSQNETPITLDEQSPPTDLGEIPADITEHKTKDAVKEETFQNVAAIKHSEGTKHEDTFNEESEKPSASGISNFLTNPFAHAEASTADSYEDKPIVDPKIEGEDLRTAELLNEKDKECTLVKEEVQEEKPVESLDVASEDIKANASSQGTDTTNYEDQSLSTTSRGIRDEKSEDKAIDEVDIKDKTLDVQSLSTNVSNEDIPEKSLIQVDGSLNEPFEKETEKTGLAEDSTGFNNADLTEKIAADDFNEESEKPSKGGIWNFLTKPFAWAEASTTDNNEDEKNSESNLLKEEVQEEKPVESLDVKPYASSKDAEDADTTNYLKDQSLSTTSQGILDEKTEEKAIDETDINDRSLDVQSFTTIIPNEDIQEKTSIQVDGSQNEPFEKETEKTCLAEDSTGFTNADLTEIKHEAQIEDVENKKSELNPTESNIENNLLKKEAPLERSIEYLHAAPENIEASSSGQDTDKTIVFEDESLTANPQRIDNLEGRTVDDIDTKEETLENVSSALSNEEIEEKSLIDVDDSEIKHENLVNQWEETPVRKTESSVILEPKIEYEELGKTDLSDNPLLEVVEHIESSASGQVVPENESITADPQGIHNEYIKETTVDAIDSKEEILELQNVSQFFPNEKIGDPSFINVDDSLKNHEEQLIQECEEPPLGKVSIRDEGDVESSKVHEPVTETEGLNKTKLSEIHEVQIPIMDSAEEIGGNTNELEEGSSKDNISEILSQSQDMNAISRAQENTLLENTSASEVHLPREEDISKPEEGGIFDSREILLDKDDEKNTEVVNLQNNEEFFPDTQSSALSDHVIEEVLHVKDVDICSQNDQLNNVENRDQEAIEDQSKETKNERNDAVDHIIEKKLQEDHETATKEEDVNLQIIDNQGHIAAQSEATAAEIHEPFQEKRELEVEHSSGYLENAQTEGKFADSYGEEKTITEIPIKEVQEIHKESDESIESSIHNIEDGAEKNSIAVSVEEKKEAETCKDDNKSIGNTEVPGKFEYADSKAKTSETSEQEAPLNVSPLNLETEEAQEQYQDLPVSSFIKDLIFDQQKDDQLCFATSEDSDITKEMQKLEETSLSAPKDKITERTVEEKEFTKDTANNEYVVNLEKEDTTKNISDDLKKAAEENQKPIRSDETKEFTQPEIATDVLEKSFHESANVEGYPTVEKELTIKEEEIQREDTAAGEIEEAKTDKEKEMGTEEISDCSSEAPVKIETRGEDVATFANEASGENSTSGVGDGIINFHEAADTTENTVMKKETSLNDILVDDKSVEKLETKENREAMISTEEEGAKIIQRETVLDTLEHETEVQQPEIIYEVSETNGVESEEKKITDDIKNAVTENFTSVSTDKVSPSNILQGSTGGEAEGAENQESQKHCEVLPVLPIIQSPDVEIEQKDPILLKATPPTENDKHVVLEADRTKDAKHESSVENKNVIVTEKNEDSVECSKVEGERLNQEETRSGHKEKTSDETERLGEGSVSTLPDLPQVSTKGTKPVADHCTTEKEQVIHKEELQEEKLGEEEHEGVETDEEKDDEECSGEHKKSDSGSEGVMVEAGDADVKVTPKKPHNILSGVGSKVKHSLAKVKKAITGKSSHTKPISPK